MPYYYNDAALGQLDCLSSHRMSLADQQNTASLNPASRTLVIGLGGMGVRTLDTLKKELKAKCGTVDGSLIRFLAVDTDEHDLRHSYMDGDLVPEETVFLDNTNLGAMLMGSALPSYLQSLLPSSDYRIHLSGTGASQNRLAGRLSLLEHSAFHTFIHALRSAFEQLRDFSDHSLNVHIVTALGGGTGSGMIIDLPYLVRKTADWMGIGQRLRLTGDIYLPDIYEPDASGFPMGANIAPIRANCYAALKEIDYYMSLGESDETYTAVYPDGAYSSRSRLFDTCTLISSQSSAGILYPNRRNKTVRTCVDHLSEELFSPVSSDNNGFSSFLTSQAMSNSIQAAFLHLLQSSPFELPLTANYHYRVIGSASLRIPHGEVTDIFFGKVFASVTEKLAANADPLTERDIDLFEKDTVEPKSIIGKEVRKFYSALVAQIEALPWDKDILSTHFNDSLLNRMLDEALAQFREDRRIKEAIHNLWNKADLLFRDPEKGPFCLAKLLLAPPTAHTKGGLFSRIRGYSAELGEMLETSKNLPIELDAVRKESAAHDLSRFFGVGKREIENYKHRTLELFAERFKLNLTEMLYESLYRAIGEEQESCLYRMVWDRIGKPFLGTADILTHIAKIAENNAAEAESSLSRNDSSDSILCLTAPALQPLKNGIRQTAQGAFNSLSETDGLRDFTADLLAELLGREETPYTPASAVKFRSFLSRHPLFTPILSRTMKDYFSEAYQGGQSPLALEAIHAVTDHLLRYAAPMYPMWNSLPLHAFRNLCCQIITVPAGFGDNNALAALRNVVGSDVVLLQSSDPFSFSCRTLCERMPLWAYKNLPMCERDYEMTGFPGLHINENSDLLPPWRDYPNPFPQEAWRYSAGNGILHTNEREQAMAEEIAHLFDNAISHGLLVKTEEGGFTARIPRFITEGTFPTEREIARFTEYFQNDPQNRDENGFLSSQGSLFLRFTEAFPCEERPIHTPNTVIFFHNTPEEQEEAAKLLLRKQPKLLCLLRKTWSFYRNILLYRLGLL